MLKRINYILTSLTLLAYASIYIPTEQIWFSDFISWSIFGFIILHIIFVFIWLIIRWSQMYISLLTLLLGFKFLMVTVAFNAQNPNYQATFSVLSYNVRAFNIFETQNEKLMLQDLLDRLMIEPADILCFQEYCQQRNGENQIDIAEVLVQKNYSMYTALPIFNKAGARFGLAIFSRYPILNRGFIRYDAQSKHGFLYADIKIKEDTIRFYNVHFTSWRGKLKKNIWAHIKSISLKHNSEFKVLLKHLRASPYKVILCGDFNAPPYSKIYFGLSKILNNAFESGGDGFGFTYHPKFPFLRIDNIFHCKSLVLKEFKILSEIDFSDHYPIQAFYQRCLK